MSSRVSNRRRQPFARVVLTLAVIALALRLLIPIGFMPAFGPEKTYITLEFCSVLENRIVLLDPKTGSRISPDEADNEDGGQDAPATSQTCAFAASSTVHLFAPEASLLFHAADWPETPSWPLKARSDKGSIAYLPWSTGPPRGAI